MKYLKKSCEKSLSRDLFIFTLRLLLLHVSISRYVNFITIILQDNKNKKKPFMVYNINSNYPTSGNNVKCLKGKIPRSLVKIEQGRVTDSRK